MKIGFLFPGQGSQTVGMGKELVEKYGVAKDIFARADQALGFDLTNLIFAGPEEELRKTTHTQPAILTTSIAFLAVLEKEGLKADIVAGHSLGEYGALVAAGVIAFEDAVRLVRKRGEFMQEAVPLGEGSMAAILGMDRDTVIDVCDRASALGVVQAVNFNCPGQIVIAGAAKAVEKAAEMLKSAGAKRTVMLPVSAPFHCTMMKPAAEKLGLELEKVKFYDAKIPVVANINAEIMTHKDIIKAALVEQAASPVLWEDCMQTMINEGVQSFVEVGPGKVLSGFTKKIAKDAAMLNIEDIASQEKTLAYFKEVR
ncbi:MAG TPA: [acyl-carrier-protein] S-malonyltransferase [Firmicutes bacterium]|nr:[acyl-carrier-protein] S-malonyltransferase [Bacillota bacterium]HWR56927.1 ACP S-malonyltransferase [Negativicutes bacterium]